MDVNITALERAFQLAKSGDFATIEAIKSKLKAEGYSVSQIVGKTLIRQLRATAAAAKSDSTNTGTAAQQENGCWRNLFPHWNKRPEGHHRAMPPPPLPRQPSAAQRGAQPSLPTGRPAATASATMRPSLPQLRACARSG